MSKFIKVKCKCGNEQVMPEMANTIINCTVCNEKLATPTGGKANITAEILRVYE